MFEFGDLQRIILPDLNEITDRKQKEEILNQLKIESCFFGFKMVCLMKTCGPPSVCYLALYCLEYGKQKILL